MNELTLSLLAIGLGLIVLLVAFNWWQERKIRKVAENQFTFTQEQVAIEEPFESPNLIDFTEDAPIIDSVADEVEFRIDIDEIAPEVHALNEEVPIAESSQQAPSAVPLKTLPEALSVEVDLIAVINLPAAEKGERLRNMLMRLVVLDKPVFAYGLSENFEWQALNREQESELFTKAAYSLQLADRAGAVSEETLKRFQALVAEIANELGAQIEWVGAHDTLSFAKELDSFCLEVDQLVNLHVINGADGRFTGTKFKSLAEANGLGIREGGAFHALNADEQILFTVVNMEKIPFSEEMLKTSTLKGVTFQMDIARTPNCTETFNQMVGMSKNMVLALHGTLVDDHQRELSDAQIEKIRQQLKLIQVQMTVRGIAPGTPLALRLFS
jgi:hypothetical protein